VSLALTPKECFTVVDVLTERYNSLYKTMLLLADDNPIRPDYQRGLDHIDGIIGKVKPKANIHIGEKNARI